MRYISTFLIGFLFLLPAVSFADTSTPDRASLLAQIASLQAQLDAILAILNAEQAADTLPVEVPIASSTDTGVTIQVVTPDFVIESFPIPGRPHCVQQYDVYTHGGSHNSGIACGG